MECDTPPPSPLRWPAWLAPALIVLTALGYYGSYLGYWFNPHDEGGTAVLTAMRLLAGEAPLRDVELGYNVGWFWPIVLLFKLCGVNFLLTRGYFFALSTITALLGWMLVRRLTRNEWAALAAGLACVIFPGSQFKNYIPLCAVANMACVVQAALAGDQRSFLRRALLGGLVLGITFLLRIDIAYLFAALWGGMLVLAALESRRGAGLAAGALAIVLATALAMQIPAWIAARRGGYADDFVLQYGGWLSFLRAEAKALVVDRPPPTNNPNLPAYAPKKSSEINPDRSTLPRVSWAAARSFEEADKSVLFILTYAAPLLYGLLLAWAGSSVLMALSRRQFALHQPATLALLVLLGSLATFPQFFFFRPDRPHLSEFMPGCMVALIGTLLLVPTRWRWGLGALLAGFFALFGWLAFDHYSAGTIAARTTIKPAKRKFFEGANGVRVWVHKDKDWPEFDGIRRLVAEHSKPGDWLVCFPYQPGFNVMTDRPTYLHSLYQDNSTASRDWSQKTIAQFAEKKPAVVIVDDRAINKVEGSRFSLWAKPAHDYLAEHYDLRGTFDTVEVFSRKP
jgi:hypothetical protein